MKSSDVGVWCLLLWSTITFRVRYVTCTGLSDAKLINRIFNTGEVRVEYNGGWCAVCTEMDYTREAHVICQHLGYLGGWAQSQQKNATQNGVEIHCAQVNTPLEMCIVTPKDDAMDCTRTLGVQCYNHSAVYLVDNPPGRPNIGRLQVQYDEIVTDVCFVGSANDRSWDSVQLNNLEALCNQLGYPGSLLTYSVELDDNSSVAARYTDDYICTIDITALSNCAHDKPRNGLCPKNSYVDAVCAVPGYVGCFNRNNIYTNLLKDIGSRQNMTTRLCIHLCQEEYGTLRFAGLVDGNMCICLDEDFLKNGANKEKDRNCNVPCEGDETDICGGSTAWCSIYDVTLGVCDDPGVPNNGSVSVRNNVSRTFQFGSIVTFICDTGFVLVGSPSIQCVLGTIPNETKWNSPVPICEEIPTTKPPTTSPTSLSTDVIIGVAISGFLLLLVFGVMVFIIIRQCRQTTSTKDNANSTNSSLTKGESYANVHHNSGTSAALNKISVSGVRHEYAEVKETVQNTKQNGSSNDRIQSQHIYADTGIVCSGKASVMTDGDPSGRKGNTSAQASYDYADSKKIHPNMKASGAEVAPDLQYACVGIDTSSRKENASPQAPYDYAEVTTKTCPNVKAPVIGAEVAPDPQYACVDIDTSTRKVNTSPQTHYDYADVTTKTSPNVKAPPIGAESDGTDAVIQYACVNVGKGNSVFRNDVSSQSSVSDMPYAYADVKGSVPQNRQPSVHLYAYADLNNTAQEAGPPSVGNNEREGWSDNVLYSTSGGPMNGNTSGQEQSDNVVQDQTVSKRDGWKENSIYAEN
ncbi:uncharacterized protein [Amphiura filiformis]|uniref:uncharacterized protein n=1 Tax=Amphiura filiformis TaxID=82378 RepID=UPI003B2220E1